MDCKASFLANSTAIGKKNNAADRPSPADRRPQGVMQRFPRPGDQRTGAAGPHPAALEPLADYGIQPLARRDSVVSNALIDRLRDEEGI